MMAMDPATSVTTPFTPFSAERTDETNDATFLAIATSFRLTQSARFARSSIPKGKVNDERVVQA